VKVLLTGADGQAGRALQASRPDWAEIQPVFETELDIRDAASVADVVSSRRPDWVINTAAYTNVDGAESDADVAMAVNARGAANLANACKNIGARMCQISTDYVFDSDRAIAIRPDQAPNPVNVYGKSKREGEDLVLGALGDGCFVIRTSWLYYQGGRNFVETMLRVMADKGSVRVIADQFGAPTSAATLANAIWSGIQKGAAGIHHWQDAGIASWYDFAVAIADIGFAMGRLDKLPVVTPISTEEYPTPARRPVFSVLDTRHTERDFDLEARHWRYELERMMEQLADA
jgi:dTDP-4-dehydrorhamnose reductase